MRQSTEDEEEGQKGSLDKVKRSRKKKGKSSCWAIKASVATLPLSEKVKNLFIYFLYVSSAQQIFFYGQGNPPAGMSCTQEE